MLLILVKLLNNQRLFVIKAHGVTNFLHLPLEDKIKDNYNHILMVTLKHQNAIVLFAKAPLAGMAKTRLQPFITPENSARLQEALIKDSILIMSKNNNSEKFVYFWPEEKKYIFENIIANLPIQLYCQYGMNLGEKMDNSFHDLFKKGFYKIVIIGVDSPTLPTEYINKAFEELNRSDMVIGPSTDGGYYLIGFKKKNRPVFTSVEWGSEKVLSQTGDLIKKHGLTFSLLPIHYDIDTIENLRFLRTHLQLLLRSGGDIPLYTGKILNEIM